MRGFRTLSAAHHRREHARAELNAGPCVTQIELLVRDSSCRRSCASPITGDDPRCASDQAQPDAEPPYRRLLAAARFRGVAFGRLLLRCSARRAPLAGVRMLSWPSSHLIRYRGDGSPRTTSSTTPQRDWRLVDSDSATTRLPTSKAIVPPSFADAQSFGRRYSAQSREHPRQTRQRGSTGGSKAGRGERHVAEQSRHGTGAASL